MTDGCEWKNRMESILAFIIFAFQWICYTIRCVWLEWNIFHLLPRKILQFSWSDLKVKGLLWEWNGWLAGGMRPSMRIARSKYSFVTSNELFMFLRTMRLGLHLRLICENGIYICRIKSRNECNRYPEVIWWEHVIHFSDLKDSNMSSTESPYRSPFDLFHSSHPISYKQNKKRLIEVLHQSTRSVVKWKS